MTELPVLGPEDQRILGSLLEKQTTVPTSYPLSANALRTACNQTSSRDPVVDYDQQTVEQTARSLKEQGLLRIVDESGDDYLYPKALFRTIALPQSIKKAVLAA